jgi:hypothetical protein
VGGEERGHDARSAGTASEAESGGRAARQTRGLGSGVGDGGSDLLGLDSGLGGELGRGNFLGGLSGGGLSNSRSSVGGSNLLGGLSSGDSSVSDLLGSLSSGSISGGVGLLAAAKGAGSLVGGTTEGAVEGIERTASLGGSGVGGDSGVSSGGGSGSSGADGWGVSSIQWLLCSYSLVASVVVEVAAVAASFIVSQLAHVRELTETASRVTEVVVAAASVAAGAVASTPWALACSRICTRQHGPATDRQIGRSTESRSEALCIWYLPN